MSGLLFIAAVAAAIAILDILAQRYGVDSRPESSDPRAPVRGITV